MSDESHLNSLLKLHGLAYHCRAGRRKYKNYDDAMNVSNTVHMYFIGLNFIAQGLIINWESEKFGLLKNSILALTNKMRAGTGVLRLTCSPLRKSGSRLSRAAPNISRDVI